MPSASVLFYGRRSRSSRTFEDLADSDDTATPRHRHRHRSSSDIPRRHRQTHLLNDPRHSLLATTTSPPLRESECYQRDCTGESSPGEINNRETPHGLSRRYCRTNRLPGSVLLAKERLLQRLRGVSVSEDRQSRETPPSYHCDDFWVVDADWETSVFREQPAASTILTDLSTGTHQQSALQEPNKRPLGLTKETLSQLHHEDFLEHQKGSNHPFSEGSNDCSICLENFLEGNQLVSLPCGHRFHTSCLYPWLRTCGECPYCRSCIMLA